jgi:DNA-binding PadR family transcriptional regulator
LDLREERTVPDKAAITAKTERTAKAEPAATAHEVAAFLPLAAPVFQVLLALADDDRHGYAILQEVTARTGGEVKLSATTLYRSIHRMLEDGLVVELRQRPAADLDDERRRYYRITPLGAAVARAEVRRLAQLLAMAGAKGFAPARG